ncbi:MAG: ATP-binding cassette domain-containing protein [Bacteroidia bacterium]|nr:ATP-binding cassette domain-containing protein [Bacteroidia bacterium]
MLEISKLSKKFRINHEHQPYLSLRDSLTNLFTSKTTTEDFWALNDVSFNVMPGDTVGIIGRNGAGKSTLLKILSKITPPTKGKVIGRGRIASLLEVGTGFHPELTGRENIFMNGSILGMKKNEIQKNFDAIVDFSGVEKFLDTPLKHYSSGMQLRLAFAVAAFLENEILIIDEVLAVGDAEFQKKCMGKMGEVSKSGRTVLFVSHNMGAVKNLCKYGALLQNGKLESFGQIENVIDKYVNKEESNNNNELLLNQLTNFSDDCFKINDFKIVQRNSDLLSNPFDVRDDIVLELNYSVLKDVYGLRIGYDIKTADEQIVFRTFHDDASPQMSDFKKGKYTSIVTIPAKLLLPKSYKIYFSIGIHNIRWIMYDKFYIDLSSTGVVGFNTAYGFLHEGVIMPLLNWKNTKQ